MTNQKKKPVEGATSTDWVEGVSEALYSTSSLPENEEDCKR